ncbi:MAG: ATP-binding cassette domain-containing protein [Chlorobi bacterium]|nr:ATP-binding cassette domain-containing protein [Chlorobiota bacterium]
MIAYLKDAVIYQRETPVLTNVNLQVERGEFLYIVGKTGSGKTSLLKTLHGEIPLKEGEGEVVGFNLRKLRWWHIPKMRRKMGVVFQDFRLLTDRTVADNLHFVLRILGIRKRKERERRIEEMLWRVGLHTKAHKMPYELSGGEQQRVAIARAIIHKPDLLLADEPTGNLDPETGEEIVKLLHTLNKDLNVTVIMTTHNYTWLEKFPAKVIRVERGKVKPAEIRETL